MSKYSELNHDDHLEMFSTEFANRGLERFINLTVLNCDNQKPLFKVVKANPILKHLTDQDVLITLNESIFEHLTEEQKKIVVEEAIAHIGYNMDSGKLVISKYDFESFTLLLQRHGFDTLNNIKEVVKAIYSQQEDN
jgi:hypothetical protein